MTLPASVLADGVSVPRIIVGGWQLSAGHRRRPAAGEETLEALMALVRSGFTTFDCADIYTGVEAVFGELRRSVHRRLGRETADSLRFHTKLVPDRSALATVDRAYVERIVDRSRARLGVERLDLVQLAWWDYDVHLYVETAAWLEELRKEGRIRHLGLTNFDVPHLSEILQAGVTVVSNQLQYSVLDRRPERGMAALCIERGIRMLCYGTLAGGFLSDGYLGATDPGPHLANRSLTKYRLIIDDFGGWGAYQNVLETLRRVGDDVGLSIAQVAVAAILAEGGVASAIVGMSSPSRLVETADAARWRPSPGHLATIRGLAEVAPGPVGDCFGLERVKGGRHASVMRYDLNRE